MKKISKRRFTSLLSIVLVVAVLYSSSLTALAADDSRVIQTNFGEAINGLQYWTHTLKTVYWYKGSGTPYNFSSMVDYDSEKMWTDARTDTQGYATAYGEFAWALNQVALTNSTYKDYRISLAATAGNIRGQEISNEDYVKQCLGVTDDSKFTKVYTAYYKHNNKGKQSYYGFQGCDYNEDDGKYYYYYFLANAIKSKDDDFIVHCFKSDTLYVFDQLQLAKANGTSDSDIDIGDPADYRPDELNGVWNLLNNILLDGSENFIARRIREGGVLTDDDRRRLKVINDCFSSVSYDDQTKDFSWKFEYDNLWGPYTMGNNGEGSYAYSVTNLNSQNGNNVVNRIDLLGGAINVKFDNSFIVFGNSGTFTTVDPGSEAKGQLQQLAVSILNSISLSGPDTATLLTQNIDKFKDESDFVYGLLSAYSSELTQCINQQGITFKDDEEFSKLSKSDSFGIVNTFFKKLVNDSIEGIEFTLKDTYKLADGTMIRMDANLENVDPLSVPEGSVYPVGYFWKNLNNYQKYVLYTTYNAKVDVSDTVLPHVKFDGLPVDGYDVNASVSVVGALPLSIDDIQKDVSEYDQSLLSVTGSVTNVARVADILGEYAVASSLYTNSSDISSIYTLYNPNLESLVTKVWDYKDMEMSWFSYLPKHIGIFGTNSANYTGMLEVDENWQRFIAMLYNVDYAFEVFAWSDLGQSYNYTPDSVKEWFRGGGDESKYPDVLRWLKDNQGLSSYDMATATKLASGWSEDQKDLMRSIIALHKLCDFLGIKKGDWSPMIDAYLSIYEKEKDFFDLLEQSGVIYSLAESGTHTQDEPLGMFFSINENTMTDQWIKGFALSALYVPMETNVYDANSILYVNDPDWVSDFFYKYAFFRKALYINTDNSAIVNAFSSGETSGKRVATLSDLLNYDRDIILTVDDNFYNANKIDTVISRLDYTAIKNTDEAEDTATGVQAVGNMISGLMDLDAGKILKTGADMYYSETLATHVTQLGDNEDFQSRAYDSFVLPAEVILGQNGEGSVLDDYEYSVKMSYGVVSAVYRSNTLYNECLRGIVADNAVFKSSKAICSTPGTTSSNWRSVYNYCMLMNLEDQMKNDCASTLDLDAPIFIDIFGNIITESGLVIIPAATNATLCGSKWTPYTVGWSEYYNNGNHLTTKDFNEDVYEWLIGQKFDSILDAATPQDYTDTVKVEKKNAGGFFWITNGEVVLRTSELKSGNLTGTVQWEALNKNSSVVQNLFFNDAYYQKGKNMYSHTLTNMIIEVLRGAPIEYIDYDYEGLSGNLNISKYGVYMAYKLEELVNNLISGTNGSSLGGNSVVTMPNLAFVSGVEYIMLYVFKIVFAVMIVALGVSLYLDATRNSLGIKSVGKFLLTCMMCIVAFTLLPNLISWTYYNANRSLLAEEAGRLMMMNYVKEYDGSEIGITSVTTPETSTELYMKVDDAGVSWWTIIPEVLFGNTASTVTELYQNELRDNAMAMTPGVQLKGDGLYVDVQDIFDSSDVQFSPATNTLSHYVRAGQSATVTYKVEKHTPDEFGNDIVTSEPSDAISIGSDNTSVVSYVSPYYVFLEQLIADINEYNVSRDVTAYSWSVGSNGHVLTYDIITPYLTSAEFLEEGYDILGLDRILGVTAPRTNYNYAFTGSDEAKMQRSLWYYDGIQTENMTKQKIDKVYEYARNFVINNHDILGKVPDEVFIKVMAMQVAIDYNKEFVIPNGNAIEIINVDTRDLMRFMVSPHADMYKYYSYSFARYVYEQSGTIGVVFSALLLVVYWLTSFLKPALMIAILALLIVNVIFRKLLFRKESRCIEGYLIGCGCLCLFNYAYALMLKVAMSIADAGFGSISALLVAFMVQVLYIVSLIAIVSIEMKDWRNNGFGEWTAIGSSITGQIMHVKNVVSERVLARSNEAYKNSSDSRRYASDDYDASSVEAMLERDRERDERGAYSPN